MKSHTLRLTVVLTGTAALALLAFWLPSARSQALLVSPNLFPIGVNAAGNASAAWFHEPSSGRVIACQTVMTAGIGLSGIQCVAAKLP